MINAVFPILSENRNCDLSQGTLFVVATPIGNLDDLSPRARTVLEQADLVAAEDTRVTGRLLSHYSIRTGLSSLHDHNEEQVVPDLIEALKMAIRWRSYPMPARH